MKKKALLLILVVAFLASCSLFSDDEEITTSTTEPVEVKLYVSQSGESKSVVFSYYDTDTDGYYRSYQYKATPKFADHAQGEKTSWTDFENGDSIGCLAQGKWEFSVREMYGKTKDSSTILREGTASFYIMPSTTNVSVSVDEQVSASAGTATVDFSITVPALSTDTNRHFLNFTVDGTTVSPTNLTKEFQSSDSLVKFSGSISVNNGYHTVSLSYLHDTTTISSEAVVVRAVSGTDVKIEGTMNNGEFADSTLTVVYAELNPSLSKVSKTSSTEITCDCGTGYTNITYAWYVNGVLISGETGKKYTFTETGKGIYTVTCVVQDTVTIGQKVMGSASTDITVS